MQKPLPLLNPDQILEVECLLSKIVQAEKSNNRPIRISSRIKWYRPPRKNLYKVGGLIPAPIPTPSHQGKGSAAIR